ncbi:MAG: acyltransferase domain-containing protein [Beutenbergiaceae bacterium]
MSPDDVKARLSAENLPELLVQLGFADDDAIETVELATRTRRRLRDLAVVAESARLLADAVGKFGPNQAPDPWHNLPDGRDDLALLALLASVPQVRAEHVRRGIPDALSWGSLADLGQQVHVHRLTHGSFGLDTYGWMRTAWSAGLLRLGRLQFIPKPTTTGWVLDVHIPRGGSLEPRSVDESFALAVASYAHHFPDYPAVAFACTSWLLDPLLSSLVPGSNLASFQERWTLAGSGYEADESVLYFVFNRRVAADGGIELAGLPRTTRLERAVLDHLEAGGHWRAFSGTTALP